MTSNTNKMSGYVFILTMIVINSMKSELAIYHEDNESNLSSYAERNLSSHVLRRPKRYAIFPEGSTFTVAICVTLKLLTPDYDIFSEAVNWALTYDLPENLADYNEVNNPLVARRKRASFFRDLEKFIDKQGYNGRTCILRSLCEVTTLLPENDGFLETIIKLLFSMPLQKVMVSEPAEHFEYDAAYRLGFYDMNDCAAIFSSCQISILQLLLNLQPNI